MVEHDFYSPDEVQNRLRDVYIYRESGKVNKSIGMIFEAYLPQASLGSICRIQKSKYETTTAEVIGFRDKSAVLMAFDDATGISQGSLVTLEKRVGSVLVGPNLLGRVVDGRGNPIDDKGLIFSDEDLKVERSLYHPPSHPLARRMIDEPLDLGIKSINGLITCGKGQRIGIMAGSGVGKSVLIGSMAKNTNADVNVIALIGERGREVREFIERDLGEEGLKRSVVVVSTSDKSPLLRMRGAFLAMTIAEYFRDEGKDVLVLMDSVTRFCMAQREIGLSMGEPPASKGYTPSVFSTIPKLLERAGMAPEKGSITGLFSVLVEGDDLDDPIADSTRSILDGHIVLSRKLAQRNHFPAVDVLQSTSRVMRSIVSSEQTEAAAKLREWLAVYQQAEDLINVGAYVKGSNPQIDQAILANDRVNRFLKQGINERASFADTAAEMQAIVRSIEAQSAQK